MFEMTVRRIVEATGARLVAGDAGRTCRGVCIDSRQVAPDMAFVAFGGERVDGNDFAPGAARAGAGAVVLTAEPAPEVLEAARETGCCVLRAAGDDGEGFLLALAAAWRAAHPEWVVVGVTGSVGKTTTKDMLARALAPRFRVHATAGNLNNLIGMPLTLLSAPDDAEALVVEMGMNHLGEIEALSRAAAPSLAVVTNVGTSHIGLLGSRDNIARAKAEMVSGMRDAEGTAAGSVRRTLALVGEDDYADFIAEGFAEPAGVEVELVGTSARDAVRATDVALGDDGHATCTVTLAGGWSGRVRLPVPGRHVVPDLLLALAVAERLGVDPAAACAAVEAMPATHMRLEVVGGEGGRPRVIDDTYNASPASMAAALDVLCSLPCEGRRVAVLGEIGELGEEAERLHALVGAYAAAKPLDLLCLVGGELAACMRDAAATMGMGADALESFATAGDAARVLAGALGERDLVLAKGSRAAGLDEFVREVLSSDAR